MWNCLANDVSATKKLVEKLGGVGRYAGWAPDGVYKGYLDDGYWYDSPDGKKVGSGGQCLYFVNLILYRSGAVKYDKLPNNWNTVEANSGPIDWAQSGDVIFKPRRTGDLQHIAILAYRNGENVEVIESNKVRGSLSLVKPNGEMISIRYLQFLRYEAKTTIPILEQIISGQYRSPRIATKQKFIAG